MKKTINTKIIFLGLIILFGINENLHAVFCRSCYNAYGWTNKCDDCDLCRREKLLNAKAAQAFAEHKKEEQRNLENKKNKTIIEQSKIRIEKLNKTKEENEKKYAQLKKQLEEAEKQLKEVTEAECAKKKQKERAALEEANKKTEIFKIQEEERRKAEKEAQENFEKAKELLEQLDKDLYEKLVEGKINIESASKSNPALKNNNVVALLQTIKEIRTDLKKISKVEKQQPSNKEVLEVANLAKGFADKAENISKNFKEHQKDTQRIEDITSYINKLDNVDVVLSEPPMYTFNSVVAKTNAMKELCFSGNIPLNGLQNSVRKEITQSVLGACALDSYFPSNIQVQGVTEALYTIAAEGGINIKNKNYKNAYSNSDTCNKILEMGRCVGEYVSAGYDAILSNVADVCNESPDAILSNIVDKCNNSSQVITAVKNKMCFDLHSYKENFSETDCLYPCECNDGKSSILEARIGEAMISGGCNAICVFPDLVGGAATLLRHPVEKFQKMKDAVSDVGADIVKEALKIITNPEEFYRNRVIASNESSQKANALFHDVVNAVAKVSDKPLEELAGNGIMTLFEGAVGGKVLSVFGSGMGKALNSLCNLAQEESVIAAAAAKEGYQIVTPIKDAIQEANNMVQAAQKLSCPTAQSVFELFQRFEAEESLSKFVHRAEAAQEAIKQFNHIPSFKKSIIDKLILKTGNLPDPGTVSGALYEAETALKLEREGEKIIEFGQHVKDAAETSSREFDLITKNKLIECKNWDWNKISREKLDKLNDILDKQKHIAQTKGKIFELHSKNPIPEKIKNILKLDNIILREG